MAVHSDLSSGKSKEEMPTKKVSEKLSFNEKREIKLIEKEIENIEDQISILNTKIEKEASNLSPADFREITNELKKLEVRMDELESRWLELDEKN